jgi:hypothetical protein
MASQQDERPLDDYQSDQYDDDLAPPNEPPTNATAKSQQIADPEPNQPAIADQPYQIEDDYD